MFKWLLIRPSPATVIGSVFFVSFLLPQPIVADLEAPTLQYIARRLLPNECQIIIKQEVAEPFNGIPATSNSYIKSPSNGFDCFRKLVGWSSNLRMNRIDARLVLENRLSQIGRNDVAAWLAGPSSRGRFVAEKPIEYESWDSDKKESNRKSMSSPVPTISKINNLIYGPPQVKSIAGSPSGLSQQSISSFPDVRTLKEIHSPDSFKDRYLAMAEPESAGHPVTSAQQYATAEPAGQHQTRREIAGSSSTPKENDYGKDPKSSQTVGEKTPREDKNKSKFPRIIPHFSDEKTAQCFRVPLSTALVVLGTIMTLTCCCALLLRNRLAACFERLRRKKPKPASKRMSADEEQGFMGPKTVGKPPKRSGRKGGGPPDVTNVGVQNTNGASNPSGESEEKPVGCCNCCARKKKKNKRKWKK